MTSAVSQSQWSLIGTFLPYPTSGNGILHTMRYREAVSSVMNPGSLASQLPMENRTARTPRDPEAGALERCWFQPQSLGELASRPRAAHLFEDLYRND